MDGPWGESAGRVGLVLALLGDVDVRASWEALLEVGEHLIQPWDPLVDVEVCDIFQYAVVDDEEAFWPRVVE